MHVCHAAVCLRDHSAGEVPRASVEAPWTPGPLGGGGLGGGLLAGVRGGGGGLGGALGGGGSGRVGWGGGGFRWGDLGGTCPQAPLVPVERRAPMAPTGTFDN